MILSQQSNISIFLVDLTVKGSVPLRFFYLASCPKQEKKCIFESTCQPVIKYQSKTGCIMLVASFNDCSDTTYKTVVVKNSVGINSVLNNQSSEFNIFPNPATQILSISSNESNPFSINLYNFNNQLLLQSKVQNKQATLNLNNYPQGIYFLQIITEKNIIMKKIIKE